MRTRRLRHRVELQQKNPTAKDYEPTNSWSTFATVWAEKFDPKGSEVFAALQTQSSMRVTFRIHYRSDVSPDHRLVFDNRVFDIIASADKDGLGKWLFVHCVEHRSNGD